MRRIKTDLIFEKNSEADEVWSALKNYLKNKKIKSLVNETSYIDYHECYHEASPPRPCVTIERLEK